MVRVLSFLFVLSLGLAACKKDAKDPARCETNWANAVQTEMTNLSNAATAYGTDPSMENCTAYKNAYQEYVDALKPFLECSAWTPQQKEAVQTAIDNAEDDISTLCEE